MSHTFLTDPTFHEFLFHVDRELSERARATGCPQCGGKLHSANYFRLPRGGPHRRSLRFSFCCASEGCRRRRTPSSMRFLGRRVYLGVLVVLASALRNGLTPARLEQLSEHFGMSERTLVRWRRWWLCDFAGSGFWTSIRGLFAVPVRRDRLPASLLEQCEGDSARRMLATLRLVLPITGGQGLWAHGF